MALPRLNDVPKYEMKIPSSGKSVRYRPYLVKEEKVLLLAYENKDISQSMNAIVDTVVSCVDADLNPRSLSTFDIEYMFTQIRSRSVGETSRIMVPCSKCESNNEVIIPLNDVKIDVPKRTTTIVLSDEVSVEMRWPSYSRMKFDEEGNQDYVSFVCSCINAILYEDNRILVDDEPEDELYEFLESLTSKQYALLNEHIAVLPQIEYRTKFVCEQCGEENDSLLQGMQTFF